MPLMPRVPAVVAVALLGWACLLPIAPAAAQSLTPEQIGQLYLDYVIHDDMNSARQLDAYTKRFYPDKLPIRVEVLRNVENMREGAYRRTAEIRVKALLNATEPQALKERLIEALRLQRTLVSQSSCKVLSKTIKPNPALPGQKNATVRYECVIADIRYSLDDALASLPPHDEAGLRDAVNAFLDAARHPQGVKTVTGSQELYGGRENGPWDNGGGQEWIAPILAGFRP